MQVSLMSTECLIQAAEAERPRGCGLYLLWAWVQRVSRRKQVLTVVFMGWSRFGLVWRREHGADSAGSMSSRIMVVSFRFLRNSCLPVGPSLGERGLWLEAGESELLPCGSSESLWDFSNKWYREGTFFERLMLWVWQLKQVELEPEVRRLRPLWLQPVATGREAESEVQFEAIRPAGTC